MTAIAAGSAFITNRRGSIIIDGSEGPDRFNIVTAESCAGHEMFQNCCTCWQDILATCDVID